MAVRSLLALTLLLVAREATAQAAATPDPVGVLMARMEQAVLTGDRAGFAALLVPGPAEGADDFWDDVSPGPERAAIKERDRNPLADGSLQLLLEILTVRNQEGRLSTWNAQVRPGPAEAPAPSWRIARLEKRSTLSGMYRLSLDTSRQYAVSKLKIAAPDLELSMDSGSAYLAAVPSGATAIVLLGRGTMAFTPLDEAERTQLRLFAGATALREPFDVALLRVNPDQFAPLLAAGMLTLATVSPQDLRRASRYFDDTIGQSLTVDLSDLSRDRWSLVPPPEDLLADVRTRKYGILTYARTAKQSEDVTLFDRENRKNIALYASPEKLAARGRFYSDDDTVDYDIESIALDADIDPGRFWIEGHATLTVVARAAVESLTLKLAESLAVRSLTSAEFGRLMFLRVSGQDSVVVKPPAALGAGDRLTIRMAYGGRLVSQELSPEAPPIGRDTSLELIDVDFTPEPRYIYSTRSFWYPQSPVLDYATATMRITVPPRYRVVASGRALGDATPAVAPPPAGQRLRTAFDFVADQPISYLACVVSRFETVSETTLDLPAPAVPLVFTVQANGRQASKARDVAASATSVLRFYASLLGDAPYSSLTLAVAESDIPGGHGPPYVALLDQQLPTSRLVWRSDPVYFPDYPAFFTAHEIAHQWWGQAVGGKNYHERWISEGFSQYFAALYAEREYGASTFEGILRQMQRSAIEASDQGPISLGYRLGHIRSDGRVFRAVLYNKSAMVLHMLRRLLGDDAFFSGLRRFYSDFKFRKAGTDDFRVAMERASRMDLEVFFDQWIFGSAVPRLKVSRAMSAEMLTLTFEQTGTVLPVPVTVTIAYVNGASDTVVVPVTEARVSQAIPLRGAVRDVKIDDDHAALATFVR